MTGNEKTWLVILLVVFAAGVAGVTAKFSLGGDAGGTALDVSGKASASLRRSGADLDQGHRGNWSCPKQAVVATSGEVLHGNHPLFRRPNYAGENRYKVMCEGWGGWYYNPPSEEYF